ncbi:MAG: hypothetical protein CVU97_03370 [Firmicutes bacterium HGW-Firmicutes-21]|nr:MAG: hypothetical protein CVU97_03370 [Firmicutes bacterium HGW-Firmicutes-21]
MLNILYVVLISMLPVIELRGAIPIGLGIGVDTWVCVAAAIIGNLIPIPFLIIFGGRILRYLAGFEKIGKPFKWILSLGERKVAKMHKVLFWGLLAFVAIPLPGTGAWTGALAAITLNLPLKKAILPIVIGVLIAAGAVTLISLGVLRFT